MTCPSSSPSLRDLARKAQSPLGWEPALTQLRSLARPELDQLLERQLHVLGLVLVGPTGTLGSAALYSARLGTDPVSLAVPVIVFQRCNRLQAHHVDAFLGYLHRTHASFGIILSTSPHTSQAARIANTTLSPRVWLLTGNAWIAHLAATRSGLRRHRLPAWVVAVTRSLHGQARGQA